MPGLELYKIVGVCRAQAGRSTNNDGDIVSLDTLTIICGHLLANLDLSFMIWNVNQGTARTRKPMRCYQ